MEERRDEPRPEVETRTEAEQQQEELRADMAETRSALAGKLEALQDQLTGTVESAQAAVEQTVETVQDSVAAVKRTLDLKYQVGQRPWLMVGGAVAAGTVVGYIIGRRLGPGRSQVDHLDGRRSPPPVAREPVTRSAPEPVSAPPAPRSPGLFAQEWQKLRGLAVGAGMALLRDWLKAEAPRFAERIDEVMNSATAKLGGEVVGPLFRQDESRGNQSPLAESRTPSEG